MRFIAKLGRRLSDFLGIVDDDELPNDPLASENAAARRPTSPPERPRLGTAITTTSPGAAAPTGEPPAPLTIVTPSAPAPQPELARTLIIVRGGETYADYADRARRADKRPLRLDRWLESAVREDDGIWRTKRDRIAMAVENMLRGGE